MNELKLPGNQVPPKGLHIQKLTDSASLHFRHRAASNSHHAVKLLVFGTLIWAFLARQSAMTSFRPMHGSLSDVGTNNYDIFQAHTRLLLMPGICCLDI